MKTNDLILIQHFCAHHNVEFSFINELNNFGLIEVIVLDNEKYLSHKQLKEIEKMMRLHYDLDINLEGIDVISNLLKRINHLEKELVATRNKLNLYEQD